MELKKKFKYNLIFAFTAQGISLFMSLVMSLFVPKLLNLTNFGYWQLFTFYFGYVGFFHFGLNDGVYLKYGGIKYEDLDRGLVGSQFKLCVCFQTIIASIISLLAFLFVTDANRQFVIYAVSICLITNNTSSYLGYIFQACNETRWFSISVIIDKIIFLLALIFLLFFKCNDFKIYVHLYVFSKFLALCYCICKGKTIIFSKYDNLKNTFIEMYNNIKIGINLMFANIASTLIIGFARFIVDGRWGIETFGQFSLAIAMVNFVLLFLGQVSMVLFPMLRQIDDKQKKNIYVIMKDALTLILPLAFVAYVPVCTLLELWLPQYKSSVVYLGILLPICTYNGKMNLLCNTYYKVLRKEKILLYVNIATMILSALLSFIAAYLFSNIICVAIAIVISIAFRSYVSELYIANLMNCNINKDILLESLIVIVFILTVQYTKGILSFVLIGVIYSIFLALNKEKILILKNMLS